MNWILKTVSMRANWWTMIILMWKSRMNGIPPPIRRNKRYQCPCSESRKISKSICFIFWCSMTCTVFRERADPYALWHVIHYLCALWRWKWIGKDAATFSRIAIQRLKASTFASVSHWNTTSRSSRRRRWHPSNSLKIGPDQLPTYRSVFLFEMHRLIRIRTNRFVFKM